jgi:hypothetical protein
MNAEGFCIDCGKDIESFEGLETCPFCGSSSTPCSYKTQVEIKINWFELQILTIWAERWAQECIGPSGAKTIYAIAERLQKQHPDNVVLSLKAQIAELKKDPHIGDIETNIPGMLP